MSGWGGKAARKVAGIILEEGVVDLKRKEE